MSSDGFASNSCTLSVESVDMTVVISTLVVINTQHTHVGTHKVSISFTHTLVKSHSELGTCRDTGPVHPGEKKSHSPKAQLPVVRHCWMHDYSGNTRTLITSLRCSQVLHRLDTEVTAVSLSLTAWLT